MGKHDKSKKKKDADSTSRKSQQKLEKKLRKVEKITGEPTIEELLRNFQNAQKKLPDVITTAVEHPSPSKTMYFNDLWKFDLSTSQWSQLTFSGDIPSPRSACLFFPSSDQRYCYIVGGYCKTSITRDLEKGVAYSDVLRLTIEKDNTHVHCVSIRPSGTRPRPPRSSMVGVTYGSNRALVFGGVHDVDSEDGEVFKSYFHNELLELELDKAKWHYFNYSNLTEVTTGLNNYSNLKSGHVRTSDCSANVKLSDNLNNMSVGEPNTKTITCVSTNKGDNVCASSFLLPSPRASASMALMGSNLYILGGIFEVGDRKITMDDFYCLDLNHPTSWECLHPGTQESQEWLETDSDDDDDQCSETDQMDVEEEISDDEELVENAPPIQSGETFTGYWNRTKQFWYEFVTKGLDNSHQEGDSDENLGQPSTSGTVIPNLARKLAKDFHGAHCKAFR